MHTRIILSLNLVRSSLALCPVHILRHDTVAQCRRVSSSLRSFSSLVPSHCPTEKRSTSVAKSATVNLDLSPHSHAGRRSISCVCGYREALRREKFKDRKKDRPKLSSTGQQESQFSAENLSPTRSTLANIIIVLKLPSDAFILFCSFSIRLLCSPFVRRELCVFLHMKFCCIFLCSIHAHAEVFTRALLLHNEY